MKENRKSSTLAKNRKDGPPEMRAESDEIQQMSGGGFGGFVDGVDYDLAFLAHSDAFSADAGDVFQREMDDAAFARGHGIQAKRLARGLDALSGNFGGYA
jgi:hypothetical protein